MEINPFGVKAGSVMFSDIEEKESTTYWLEVKPFKNSQWRRLHKPEGFSSVEDAVDRINCATRTPSYYRVIDSKTNEVVLLFNPEQEF